MIQCNGCGFGVNESMRFALMKNLCPSCGSGLFSNKDSSIINLIQSNLKSERFSSGLTETQIYDISLFFFNEIKNGFVRQIFSDLRQTKDSEVDPDEISHQESDVDDIRREIEAEMADKLSSLDDSGDVTSEDALSKAERLKRMHQQRILANPNLGKEATINPGRRSGFKGVSRST